MEYGEALKPTSTHGRREVGHQLVANLPLKPADAFPAGTDHDERAALLLQQGKVLLAEAVDVRSAREIWARADGIAHYLRDILKGPAAAVQRTIELQLWAERRVGQLLIEQAENGKRQHRGGDRKSNYREGKGRINVVGGDIDPPAPTLADQGLSRDQASKSQRLAAIPTVQFEELLKQHSEAGNLTRSAILRGATPTGAGAKLGETDGKHFARYLRQAAALGGEEANWAQAHLHLLTKDGPAILARRRTISEARALRSTAAALVSVAEAIELSVRNGESRALQRLQSFFPSAEALALATEDASVRGWESLNPLEP